MKKIFRGQVILSAVYTVTAIVVFLYTLVFMTEYNDLFGLKMPQNKQIAQFYEVILQGFNRQILVWAIVGIIGILMIVLLEIRTAVPDRFAAAVMTVYMGCCCFGAVNAIRNILAIWAYYKGLDFQYLYADGITGYELKFTTFQVGIGIYSVQIIVCVAFAAVLLLIPAAVGAVATPINYDILSYLPQELDSRVGQLLLETDYHLASTNMITVEGMPTNELLAMKAEIDEVPDVLNTFWLSDVLDPAVPVEMLPADLQQFLFGKNDSTILIVQLGGSSVSEETMGAVAQIKKILRKNCFFGGISVILSDTKELVMGEMPLYVLCAVAGCLLVLFLSLESWLTPFLFMLGLLFPLVYNFGTNIFLGQVCFITEALAAVLQLGVTMDFSIFLLHRYEEEKASCASNEEAMENAICKTMSSIAASSLTTIAGFLALCAMQLTLGADLGVVMAKGVALGVLCTIVILPSLILFFDRWVEKYRHRTFMPRLTHLSHFVSKHPVPVVAVFLLLMIPFGLAQSRTDIYYNIFAALPQDMPGIVGTNKLGEDFGMMTNHFILVREELTASQVSGLCDEIKGVDGITQVVSLDSIAGPGFETELLPDELMNIVQNGGYKLILANGCYKSGSDALNAQVDELVRLVKTADPEGLVTGEGAMMKDLVEIADEDFKNVNIWSIAAVLVIIALSFRSLSVPVLLVASIEAAIAINMGIPYFIDDSLPFIASIVIGTIQLGATVDYSILMTTRYREERLALRSPKAAAQQALEHCSQSILTSGLTFFAATFGVAAISKVELLESICMLISRGALISMAVILLVLPAALMLLDGLICRTTYHWLTAPNAAKE